MSAHDIMRGTFPHDAGYLIMVVLDVWAQLQEAPNSISYVSTVASLQIPVYITLNLLNTDISAIGK